jgi:cyclopropane-fatty-acyl-phospholipid synthase
VNSKIYEATLSHQRKFPVEHEFNYPVPVFIFDLAELESKTLDNSLFRTRPGPFFPRLLSLANRDYLYYGEDGLRQKLKKALAQAGLEPKLAESKVRLITSARFLGYVFNPVSFWLIYSQSRDDKLSAVVAEVNNTFGEKHIYALKNPLPSAFPARFKTKKDFHVSPFNDLKGDYDFLFFDSQSELRVEIELIREGKSLLKAKLWSDQPGRPVTTPNLARLLFHPQRGLTYPRILLQAARLYFQRKLPVHEKPEPQSPMTIRKKPPGPHWFEAMATRLVLRQLNQYKTGRLTLETAWGDPFTTSPKKTGPQAMIKVLDPAFFRLLLLRQGTGLGEAYVQGMWKSPDLSKLFDFFLANEKKRNQRERPNHLIKPLYRLLNLKKKKPRKNDKKGSQANIAAHYDLSNQVFSLFLDQSMTYSCAVFKDPSQPTESLAKAQQKKLDMIAQKARLEPGMEVLELGCGWGGFARLAAEKYDCRVTALTRSEKQHQYLCDLVNKNGLTNKIKPVLGDYRDMQGQYQAVVSIEMIEAMGHKYHKTYFQTIDRLLAPKGRSVIQAITIIDQRYDAYRQIPDWISTYIFPGGLLPSLTRMAEVAGRHTSLIITEVEDIGKNYVPTLAAWRKRFLDNWDQIKAQGFDQSFKRTFEYYFSICEAGFRFGHIHDLQLVLTRPLYHAGLKENPA